MFYTQSLTEALRALIDDDHFYPQIPCFYSGSDSPKTISEPPLKMTPFLHPNLDPFLRAPGGCDLGEAKTTKSRAFLSWILWMFYGRRLPLNTNPTQTIG